MIRYKFTKAEYAFLMLFDRRLKASRPNEFNDVFEFCPVSDPESVKRHALNAVLSDPNQTRDFYQREVEKDGYDKSYEHFNKYDLPKRMAVAFDRKKSKLSDWDLRVPHDASEYVAVICLSRHPCLYLQWSYYADCHRGCAIGIEVFNDCFGKARLNEEVTYVKDRPKFVWGLDKEARLNQLREITKAKSDIWKHEHEHRLAFPIEDLIQQGGHCFVSLNPQAVRRVFYGAQMNQSYKCRIETVLRHTDFSHVVRYQVERDAKRFLLRFKRLP